MATFRILSFDGGGIKGALSTRLLFRLSERYPDLISKTNLFAGTSTGSLIALGLAYGKPPHYIDNLYSYENLKYVFSPSSLGYFRPKYRLYRLKNLLLDVFPPHLTLGSLSKYVFVPSFNVKGVTGNAYEPVIFTNLLNLSTIHSTLIDAALSSSAAPTYFPSYKDNIDGGVIANSPTTSSLIFTASTFRKTYNITDFRLLSIGTGYYPINIPGDTRKWGLVQWLYNPFSPNKTPIISMLFDNPTMLDTQYSALILEKNFFRLNPNLPYPIEMDDYKQVNALKELADTQDLSAVYRYIEKYYLT